MIWYLFSFEGRINRAKYWLAGLVMCGLMLFLIMLLFVPISYLFGGSQKLSINLNLTNIFAVFDPQSYRTWSRSKLGSIAAHAIVMPPVLWMFLATTVKRLHDRDRSGWWLVVFFALPGLCGQFADRLPDSCWALFIIWPIPACYLWGVVELYFLPGTRSTNRFGPNPLGKQPTRPRSPTTRLRATTAWDQQGEIELAPHLGSPPPGMRVKPGT
jgi:uncharacterized membrane protein YhaH (DUF805 family)